jgi:signal transduction histidine kinase
LLESIGIAAGVALRSARLVERLQRSIVVERRLAECTAALRSGRSLPEVLDLVARRFVALLPGTSCWINVLSPDGTTITRVATTVDRPGPAENRLDDLPREDVETIRQIWMRDPGYPIVIPDLAERRGWERFIPPEIGTGMLLPLSDGRAVHGFIALGRESEPFSADELAIAVAFADRVGFAFTQARLTDALQLRVNLTEALYRLSDAVVRTSDLKAALAALNRDVCAELGVECVRLTFRDAAFAKALRLPPPSRSELAMIKAWGGKGGNETSPEGNELAVPVPMNNRTTGVLWVRSEEFDAGRIEFARAVAVGLGEVAQKAKLRRTAEERARQLAVAAERERLAHDLHDAVGQTFYGMGMKLQDLVREVEGGPLAARLESLRELAALGVADVRSAVDALSAMHLRALGFLPSIRALARQFTLATSVPAELRLAETNLSLPPEVESALYRTLHEALVNVHRHARATGVVISLRRGPKILELMVRDDGVGLDQRQVADWRSAAHFGMRRMAKSIEEVGGRFKATAAHPRGLLVHAVVPLKV